MKDLIVVAVVLVGVANAVNVALNKPTFQSSTAFQGDSGRAVDGNDNSDYTGSSCTHTDFERNAYWGVDLGKKQIVSSVEITNRADCCTDRLQKFDIIVTNKKPASKNEAYSNEERCARREATFPGSETFECDKPIVGRYVVIRFNDNASDRALTLCEVKVEASAAKGVFCHRDNTDCYKHDIGVLKDVDLEQCKDTCYQRDDCMSIQYNHKRECYIKNYACTDKETVQDKNGNDFIKVESLDQCPIAFEYCHRSQVDCKGHDIARLSGLNLAQCQMRCSVTRDCRSVQFQGNRCWLKNFACANFELMGKESGHDYVRVYDQAQCRFIYNIFD